MNSSIKKINISLKAILFCLTVFYIKFSYADSLPPLININIENGLSNNSVTCLMQDSYGFMWMGTYDGLNRYDGYEFKIFRNKWKDTASIVNNHIVALQENNDHSIWVGTLKGVSLFNYHNFKFTTGLYYPKNQKTPKNIAARVRMILNDNLGATYIATEDDGLLVLNKNQKVFKQIKYGNEFNFNASAICNYTPEQLFVCIKNIGLCVYNKKNGRMFLMDTAINDATKLLYVKEKGNLLIGTENGLFQYNLKSKAIRPFNNIFKHYNITNLKFDREGSLWVSTDGGGAAKVNLKDSSYIFIKQGLTLNSLKSDAVYSVYEDNKERKWIATLRGGVSIIDTTTSLFTTIRKNPYNKNSLVSNFVLSFSEDKKHNIWIGTDGGGLSYWDVHSNNFTNYTHNKDDSNSISGNYVVSILEDDKDRIWVATFNGGIDLFDPATKHFIHYKCYNPIRKKNNINLWKLYEDSKHHIWAGSTMGDPLFLFNDSIGQFKLFDDKLINIHTIYEDSEGNLWGGDYDQLIKIDVKNKHHKYIYVGYPVRAILEDTNHNLWVGTEGGGLLLYDKVKKSFLHYTEKDGLPSNSILNLLEDKNGHIWCSTYNGLSEFDVQSKKFINYDIYDGLQSNQFNYNAALKLQSGEFLFGGINGFNKFYPENIHKKTLNLPVIITDFQVNNIPIENTTYLPADRTPVDFNKITIPFNKANISITFSGLSYTNSRRISYSYFLEGWDKDWSMPSKQNVVNYTRLYENNYKLHIRTINPDGKWSGTERIIDITVLPPWYRTWLAYLIYLLIIGAIIYSYLKYKQRQTKMEFEMKLTRLNAKSERELNERKIAFFTNVAHEFRTMLTLIINPIKDLMKNANETEKPEEIRIAYKNSKRMLSLVGQLLMFRKADVEETQLRVSKINLYTLVKEAFDSFSYQAKTKKLIYELTMENKELFIYGDYEKLEIALFNLLSNAMKYTPDGGEIRLGITDQKQSVVISISDTGRGIAKEISDKIFQKYYQINTLESTAKTGFGIGLFLVKNFIEKHHGSIDFTSEIGKGTQFNIKLLKGSDHFKGLPINEDEFHELDGLVKEMLPESQDKGEETSSNQSEIDKSGLELIRNRKGLIDDKKKILIADDNEEIREYLKKIFIEEFNVLEVSNGKDVLEMVKNQAPDLIILDLVMPGIYGDEICQIIKSDSNLNHIPIIILTSEVSSETKLRCVESGADDYITKPFEKEFLIARSNNLLKTKSNLQKYFFNEITLQENHQQITPEDKAFLDQCVEIIGKHLTDDDFEIKILADELYMSHSSLYKKIHNISGYSVNGFIRFVRLRKAAELFIESSLNVTETAFAVGFSDVKYFRSQFQKLYGLTPSAYIKKYRAPFRNSFSLKKDPDPDN